MYEALFGSVTTAGLMAALIFVAGLTFFQLQTLNKEIQSIRELQGRIAAKVEELERRLIDREHL
jgi:CHASE3 domain sensor protein